MFSKRLDMIMSHYYFHFNGHLVHLIWLQLKFIFQLKNEWLNSKQIDLIDKIFVPWNKNHAK